MSFLQSHYRSDIVFFSVHSIRSQGGAFAPLLIVIFDDFIKVVSTRFFHHKVIIFLLEIKSFVQRCFGTINISCSLSHSHPLVLATNDVRSESKKTALEAMLTSERVEFNIKTIEGY